MEKVKWIYVDSAINENAFVVQHAYIDDGGGGNTSLCGRRFIYEDGSNGLGRAKFIDLVSEEKHVVRCKICDKIESNPILLSSKIN